MQTKQFWNCKLKIKSSQLTANLIACKTERNFQKPRNFNEIKLPTSEPANLEIQNKNEKFTENFANHKYEIIRQLQQQTIRSFWAGKEIRKYIRKYPKYQKKLRKTPNKVNTASCQAQKLNKLWKLGKKSKESRKQ